MIGYHYTTQEAWEQIQVEGMYPAPIREHEYARFNKACTNLPPDAIWVWRGSLSDAQAFIALITLADLHQSFDFVLLELDYDTGSSALHTCKLPGDTINLTCEFTAGRLKTNPQPIDLIINPVPPMNITKLWEGDLLQSLRDHHPAWEEALC